MKHLLLLHGAIGAKDQLYSLADHLKNNYCTHLLNFSGHGGSRLPQNFSIRQFACDVLKFLEQNSIDQPNIFGYSMGGYVAMYLARHYPARVKKIVTLATKFYWDIATAEKEAKMLEGELIAQKLPGFAKQLELRHAPNDWKTVLNKTKEMLTGMGADNTLKLEDYSQIKTPCLLLLGEKDNMVSLGETIAVKQTLPNSKFLLLPETVHPIEKVNLGLLASAMKGFLQ